MTGDTFLFLFSIGKLLKLLHEVSYSQEVVYVKTDGHSSGLESQSSPSGTEPLLSLLGMAGGACIFVFSFRKPLKSQSVLFE